MAALLLTALLIASPGALDRNGAHLGFDGEYHFHSGPSYNFRYLDSNGKIWEGQGPRPEENLLFDGNDILWKTMFLPLLVATAIAGLVVSLKVEKILKKIQYRAHVNRKLHARFFEPLPVLASAGSRRPRISSRRRTFDRRRTTRPEIDRRFVLDRRLAI